MTAEKWHQPQLDFLLLVLDPFFVVSYFPPRHAPILPCPLPPTPARCQVSNQPLPTLPIEPVVRVRQDAAGLMLVLCLAMATSVLSASFCIFLVRCGYEERARLAATYSSQASFSFACSCAY